MYVHAQVHVYAYVCTYVCMYVRMYEMYVQYAYVCMCIHIDVHVFRICLFAVVFLDMCYTAVWASYCGVSVFVRFW